MNIKVFEDLSELFASIANEHILRGKFTAATKPQNNEEVVALEQNIANILLSSVEFRCILKIHYGYQVGEYILKEIYKSETINKQKIDDLFKESCNLIAGRFKKTLDDIGVSVSLSIPVRTRGYDEFFFDKKDSDIQTMELSWKMENGDQCFFMSAFIEILDKDKAALIKIEKNQVNPSSNIEDEVELF